MKPGDVFEGTYRIVEELGRGAHAAVFLGEHVEIGQHVAIKLMHIESPRFTREGRVLATLKSPNTVRLLAFGRTADDEQYLISEWIDGESLQEYMRRVGPVGWEKTVEIIAQILESLDEAHGHDIIHRDIKPGNVMLVDERAVKVLDFGIAKSAGDKTLTEVGQVVGTPRYIAPEFIRGDELTPAADVFAVGLLAYELLTGEAANTHATVESILTRHLDSVPYELPEHVDIPAGIRRVFDQMTRKQPSARPEDAGAALRALRMSESGRSSLIIPAPDPASLRPTLETPLSMDAMPIPVLDEITGAAELAVTEEAGLSPEIRALPGFDDATMAPAPPPPAPDPTEPPPPRAGRPKAALAAVAMALVLGVLSLVAFMASREDDSGSAESDVSAHSATASQEATARKLVDRGVAHYQQGRLLAALKDFREVEDGADTQAKEDLATAKHRERAIDQLLFDAVESTQRADTAGQFHDAMKLPKDALQIYPDHPRITELLERLRRSADDAASGRKR